MAARTRFPRLDLRECLARQVVEAGLADTVREILAVTDLNPSCLWLVLSETALMRAGHSASVEMSAVEALGVHLGIDDFGAGNASPTNLQRLPIDFLKIRRSFITNLSSETPTDADGNAIVATLTELGRGLKLRTIADGIERGGRDRAARATSDAVTARAISSHRQCRSRISHAC